MSQATHLRRNPRRLPQARLTVLLVLLGATLAACTAPASSPSPSASAAASQVATLEDCGATDLKTSQGTRIDLTGVWTGGTTIHDVRQLGDCVWWVGLSDWPNEGLGDAWKLQFSGHVHPDFTLTGEFVEVYRSPTHGGAPGRGFVTFKIEVQNVDGAEVIVLHRDNNAQPGDQGDFYTADTLTRIR